MSNLLDVALRDVRAGLLAEVNAANEHGRAKVGFAMKGDFALGSPRAIKAAEARYIAAVSALAEFDREHGTLS
ncbi:MAG: hypothetical protein ACREXP_10790 [Steroidobacteraceae bacterium]